MVPASEFWLYKWIDDQGIRTPSDAEGRLRDKVALADLRAKASLAPALVQQASNQDLNIAAGAALDFTGRLDCSHPDCRKRQVDRLFRRIWHYFDRVIVSDTIGHAIACHWKQPKVRRKRMLESVLETVEVLLYLREIGADTLVAFVDKSHGDCELHWRKHAEDAGLQDLLTAADSLIPRLAKEGKYHFARRRDRIAFRFDHPNFQHTCWGKFSREEGADCFEMAAATVVVRRFVAALTTDIVTAQKCAAPLGSAVYLHEELLTRGDPTRCAPVAFRLDLPVLETIPTRELLKIRADERECFQRFQRRLREAVDERSHLRDGSTAEKTVEEIRRDLIEPELAHIRDRLKSAERTMNRKAGVGIYLGALTTTCGLLFGMAPPLAAGAGVATVVNIVGSAAAKYLDDRREASLEDMYFIWKALDHHRLPSI